MNDKRLWRNNAMVVEKTYEVGTAVKNAIVLLEYKKPVQ
jgi:hypothetical protein